MKALTACTGYRRYAGWAAAYLLLAALAASDAAATPPDALNVVEFGAVPNDDMDDAPAVQAAVDSLLDSEIRSGTIFFPEGRYHVGTTITIPTALRSVEFAGNGWTEQTNWGGSWLINATENDALIAPVGNGSLANLRFHGMAFTQGSLDADGFAAPHCAGRDIIGVAGGVSAVVFLAINDVYFRLCNPESSFVRITDTLVAEVELSRIRGQMGNEHIAPTSPAIDIRSKLGSNIFGFSLRDAQINSQETAVAPIVRLVDASSDGSAGSGQVSANIKFENFAMETPGGGGIELRSIFGAVLENVSDSDLLGTPSQPIVLLGTEPGSLMRPSDITLINCTLTSGDPSGTSLMVESGPAVAGPTIISSTIRSIDSQGSPILLIGSSRAEPRLVGNTRLVRIRENGRLQGIAGISGSSTQAVNLRGTVTVAGNSNIGRHDFEATEPDSDYHIVLTPTELRGGPSAGSTRVRRIEKDTDGKGFSVQVERPPGSGKPDRSATERSVTFDWILIR